MPSAKPNDVDDLMMRRRRLKRDHNKLEHVRRRQREFEQRRTYSEAEDSRARRQHQQQRRSRSPARRMDEATDTPSSPTASKKYDRVRSPTA